MARRSKNSILKEISPEYSLEGLMLKLKLQHFGHLMRRTDSCTGREEGSGWGTHVYLWQIHFDIWQNQYSIVKLNNWEEVYACYKMVVLLLYPPALKRQHLYMPTLSGNILEKEF